MLDDVQDDSSLAQRISFGLAEQQQGLRKPEEEDYREFLSELAIGASGESRV